MRNRAQPGRTTPLEPSHVGRPLKTLLGVLLLLTLAVHPDDTLRILAGAWRQGLFLLHLG